MKRTMTIKNVEGIDHHTSWLEQKKQDVYLCILCVMRYALCVMRYKLCQWRKALALTQAR